MKFVHDPLHPEGLLAAVRVPNGKPSETLPPVPTGSFPGNPREERRLLTAREKQVLRMICEGLSNAQIAAQLGMTRQGVKSEMKRLFQKIEGRKGIPPAIAAAATKTQIAAGPLSGANSLSVFGTGVAGAHHKPYKLGR